MAWRIELSGAAEKALKRLDPHAKQRILRFLRDRLLPAEDPRRLGKPLTGTRLGNLWRYRIGDYRLVADLQDGTLTVLVVRIGHRREVYRQSP
ncbi:type II toxin-antitoxin system RelE family toxin [Luteimonas arsenica]|uniref:type II toxin-antitoxin system RelE family toxin n=1 Tax=Luteimonas arsenica TaxID=1586242 RepID=UPI0010558D3E|nr:type II toxin-antitoxin system RelE/ParE family toxin [Luteimonas arsenica]